MIAGLKEEYSRLLLEALKEGLQAIWEAKKSGGYIGTYYDFPKLSFKENGLPSLFSLNVPEDYEDNVLSDILSGNVSFCPLFIIFDFFYFFSQS